MITQEQADRVVALNNIRDAVNLLNATLEDLTVYTSKGIKYKKIVITYDRENDQIKTSN